MSVKMLTKYQTLSFLLPSFRIYIIQFSRRWKTKIRVPAWLGVGEALFLGGDSCFLLYPQRGGKRASSLSLSDVSSYKSTNPMMRAPHSGPYQTLITSQRPHLQIYLLGLRVQHMNLGAHKHSVQEISELLVSNIY